VSDATEIVERTLGLAVDTIDLLAKETQQLRTDGDELRRVLQRCLMYGQLPNNIGDETRKLLEAKA